MRQALGTDKYTHKHILKISPLKLRAAGLSGSKVKYIKGIALAMDKKQLDFKKIRLMDDEQVIAELVKLKGIGRWTAEMILMFTVNRPDIFPVDDIGIRNELKKMYGIEGEGKKFIEQMHQVSALWKPYRTLACRHLWRHRDQ